MPEFNDVLKTLDADTPFDAQHGEHPAASVIRPTLVQSQPAPIEPQPAALELWRQSGAAFEQPALVAFPGPIRQPG